MSIDNNLLEIQHLNEKIKKGKEKFTKVISNVLDSVMKASSLDLMLDEKESQINDISSEIFELSNDINNSSQAVDQIVTSVAQAHTSMTEQLNEITSAAECVLEGTEESSKELNDVNLLAQCISDNSSKMQDDMESLAEVIKNIQNVLKEINSISVQTNILALNASIEAARAGAAGKGFSIVAEEVRALSKKTKLLTTNMEGFVETIQNASNKSVGSVNSTVSSLDKMNADLELLISNSKNNKEKMSVITSSISAIASSSEEINESVDNVRKQVSFLSDKGAQLVNSSEFLNDISVSINNVIKPVSAIEKQLDSTACLLGDMTLDEIYMMDNKIFIENIKNAVKAHINWGNILKDMIDTSVVKPLQTDSHKCGFGHFYYAIKPQNKEIAEIWKKLEQKHKNYHEFGITIINLIKENNIKMAKDKYEQSKKLSEDLISDFKEIIKITEDLEIKKINVFENIK